MNRTQKTVVIFLAATLVEGHAASFQEMVDSYGTTQTLIGFHHATTSNPDGTSINFWDSMYEGQPAVSASLSNPHMAGADAYGNIFIADKSSHAILKISTNGIVRTFAGTHTAGFNGDGPAPANSLQLFSPNGLFVLPSGVVYLLDPGNHRIRRVGLNGEMTTVVNDLDPNWAPSGRGLWVSHNEQLIYYTHEYPPVPPSIIANGAVLKKWTPTRGIETICDRSVGFSNPANMDVNPADGKLYITDRAEEDVSRMAQGLFRIDGPNQRTRITGDASLPNPSDGLLAINCFIEQPRGIAFQADGSYFICGHKDGNIWFVDAAGVIFRYLNGSGKKDGYILPDGAHPPLVDKNYFAQPRAVTVAPNGNLLVVCNDSGFLFRVQNLKPAYATNLTLRLQGMDSLLEWVGDPKRGFRIQRSFDLSGSSAWDDLSAVSGEATKTLYTDSEQALAGHCFYRIMPSL